MSGYGPPRGYGAPGGGYYGAPAGYGGAPAPHGAYPPRPGIAPQHAGYAPAGYPAPGAPAASAPYGGATYGATAAAPGGVMYGAPPPASYPQQQYAPHAQYGAPAAAPPHTAAMGQHYAAGPYGAAPAHPYGAMPAPAPAPGYGPGPTGPPTSGPPTLTPQASYTGGTPGGRPTTPDHPHMPSSSPAPPPPAPASAPSAYPPHPGAAPPPPLAPAGAPPMAMMSSAPVAPGTAATPAPMTPFAHAAPPPMTVAAPQRLPPEVLVKSGGFPVVSGCPSPVLMCSAAGAPFDASWSLLTHKPASGDDDAAFDALNEGHLGDTAAAAAPSAPAPSGGPKRAAPATAGTYDSMDDFRERPEDGTGDVGPDASSASVGHSRGYAYYSAFGDDGGGDGDGDGDSGDGGAGDNFGASADAAAADRANSADDFDTAGSAAAPATTATGGGATVGAEYDAPEPLYEYGFDDASTTAAQAAAVATAPAPSAPEARIPADTDTDTAAVAKATEADSTTFNARYQAAIDEQAAPGATLQQQLDAAVTIRRLVQEFTLEATRIGRTIITELALPEADKSIAPVDVGGIAGGTKFVCGSIFLKFVADFDGLYGGDEWAQKSAEHELKGLRAYLTCGVPQLRTPLFCLIDWRGYRLMATSVLPLWSGSLVYGSADAGRTVHADVKQLNECMRQAAEAINIDGHIVGTRAAPGGGRVGGTLLHSCCDIEAHVGGDGRYYVLDTARVLPPEAPLLSMPAVLIPSDHAQAMEELRVHSRSWRADVETALRAHWRHTNYDPVSGAGAVPPVVKVQPLQGQRSGLTLLHCASGKKTGAGGGGDDEGANVRLSKFLASPQFLSGEAAVIGRVERMPHLVRMLRPELVKAWREPLSSDAMTLFGMHDAVRHNRRVAAATEHLRDGLVREFADSLASFGRLPSSGQHLTAMMHECGLNVRYLALVRTALPPGHTLRLRLLTEMISRVVKGRLRELLRSVAPNPGRGGDESAADAAASGGVAGASNSAGARASGSGSDRYAADSIEYLNQLFGLNTAARLFFTVTVKVLLVLKFGSYGRPKTWDTGTGAAAGADASKGRAVDKSGTGAGGGGGGGGNGDVVDPAEAALLRRFVPSAVVLNNFAESHPLSDLRPQVLKLALFGALQRSTGVVFSVAANRRFQDNPMLFEVDAPFDEDDLSVDSSAAAAAAASAASGASGAGGASMMQCRVRAVSGDAELLAAVRRRCGVAPTSAPPAPPAHVAGAGAGASAAAARSDHYASTVRDVFGEGSAQMVAAELDAAHAHLTAGNTEVARVTAERVGRAVLKRTDLDPDCVVAVWMLRGTCAEACGNARHALHYFQRALGVLEQNYGAGAAFEPEGESSDLALVHTGTAGAAMAAATAEYEHAVRQAAAALRAATGTTGGGATDAGEDVVEAVRTQAASAASRQQCEAAAVAYGKAVSRARARFQASKLRAHHGAARDARDKVVFRAHPLATVLADRIVVMMLRMQNPELAHGFPHPTTFGGDDRLRRTFRDKAHELLQVLPHPSDPAVCRQFFGYDVPLSALFEPLLDIMHPNHGTALALLTERVPLEEALRRLPPHIMQATLAHRREQWRAFATGSSSSARRRSSTVTASTAAGAGGGGGHGGGGSSDAASAESAAMLQAEKAWTSQVSPFYHAGRLLASLPTPFHTDPVMDGGAPGAPTPPGAPAAADNDGGSSASGRAALGGGDGGYRVGYPWPDVEGVAAARDGHVGVAGTPPALAAPSAGGGATTAGRRPARLALHRAPSLGAISVGDGSGSGTPLGSPAASPHASATAGGGDAAAAGAKAKVERKGSGFLGLKLPRAPSMRGESGASSSGGGSGAGGGTPSASPTAGSATPVPAGTRAGAGAGASTASGSGTPRATSTGSGGGSHGDGGGRVGRARRDASRDKASATGMLAPAEVEAAGGLAVEVKGHSRVHDLGNSYNVYYLHVNTTWPELSESGAEYYTVTRRWNRVKHLHQQVSMRARQPSTQPPVRLPELPGTGAFGGFLSENVPERERALDAYLRVVTTHPMLRRSPEVVAFLRKV